LKRHVKLVSLETPKRNNIVIGKGVCSDEFSFSLILSSLWSSTQCLPEKAFFYSNFAHKKNSETAVKI
jgi:hypothetical protein